MLYVIQNGHNVVVPIPAKYIVNCVITVQKILEVSLHFVFTDGHAVDRLGSFHEASAIQKISYS